MGGGGCGGGGCELSSSSGLSKFGHKAASSGQRNRRAFEKEPNFLTSVEA